MERGQMLECSLNYHLFACFIDQNEFSTKLKNKKKTVRLVKVICVPPLPPPPQQKSTSENMCRISVFWTSALG